MATPVTIILSGGQRKQMAHRAIEGAPAGSVVEIRRPTRTLPQNHKLHAALTDIARQLDWPVGSGIKRDTEAWKDITTAALRSATHGLDVVPGINGGFVLLGMHTSRMSKQEMIDLIDLVHAFGAEHGVRFGDEADTPSTSSQGAEGNRQPLGVAG